MHTRRRLLGAVPLLGVAGLAGCLTTFSTGSEADSDDPGADGPDAADPLPDGGDSSDGDAPDDDLPDETRLRGTGGPGVTLAGLDDQPPLPLRVDVSVTRAVATDEHPPGLRVVVTNAGEERIGLGEGRAVVFAYQSSTDGSLALLPADYDAPAEAGCWRLTDGVAVTMEYRVLELAPGESVEQELSLYAAHDEADACLPVGEHRFESVFTVFETPAEPAGGDRATWGFSVLLE